MGVMFEVSMMFAAGANVLKHCILVRTSDQVLGNMAENTGLVFLLLFSFPSKVNNIVVI